MPRETSVAAAQTPAGRLGEARAGRCREAARMAAPRPRAAMFGTRSGPERPSSARPSAQAWAMWPRVLAPSSPKAAASGAPPQPTESMTRRKARGIRRSARGSSGRLGGRRRRRCGRRRGSAPRRRRAPAASAAWMRASGVSGSTEAPRPSEQLEADGVVDGVAGAAAAAAELDHREAEGAGVDGGDEAVARRRSPRRSRARRRRCASKSSRKSVGPPSAATMRSKRSAAAPEAKASRIRVGAGGGVGREAGGGEELAAERHGHVVEPAVDRVAAQEAGGVRHLERVAGGGGERLVHVGDQRAGRAAGAVRHLDQRLGERAGVVQRRP